MQIIVPRILQPRTLTWAIEPKTYLIQDKVFNKEPKKMFFAAGSGGVPPSGNNGDDLSHFKTNLSPEIIKKIQEKTGNINKITHKMFDIYKTFSKC